MKKSVFDAADEIAERISEVTEQILESEDTARIRGMLSELGKVVGSECSVALRIKPR